MIPVPSLIDTVNIGRISLLTTDPKDSETNYYKYRRDWGGHDKDLNVGDILGRRSRPMWDIFLPTEDSAKSLAGCIMTSTTVRVVIEYMGN